MCNDREKYTDSSGVEEENVEETEIDVASSVKKKEEKGEFEGVKESNPSELKDNGTKKQGWLFGNRRGKSSKEGTVENEGLSIEELEAEKLLHDYGLIMDEELESEINKNGNGVLNTREEYVAWAVERTISQFVVINPDMLASIDRGDMEKSSFEKAVKRYIKSNINISKFGKLTKDEREKVFEQFDRYVWGLDVLEELVADKSVGDININAYDDIYIKVNGKRVPCNVKFRSEESFEKFAEHIALRNHRSLSELDAIQKFVDSDSSPLFRLRFDITTALVNSPNHAYISIRKIPKFKEGMDKLVEDGMMSEAIKELLIKKVKNGESFIFCGKGGSGKTKLMNELIEYLPNDVRYDVIQDYPELFTLKKADCNYHEMVEPRGEGKVDYSLTKLGKNSLITDVDMLIVGEVKGPGASATCDMAYTDHIMWTSTHAVGVEDAHEKIASYAEEETGKPFREFLPKIASVKNVVYIHKYKVLDIGELSKFDKQTYKMEFKHYDLESGVEKK